MPVLQIKRQAQIQENIVNRVVGNSALSDLADSSGFKHLAVAFARELDAAYFQLSNLRRLFSIDSARGDDLDARARDIQPGRLRRSSNRRAVGTIVFSRRTNDLSTVIIPAGTVAITDTGIKVRTTQQTQITATTTAIVSSGVGLDSGLVSAQAVEAGEAGNIASGSAVRLSARVAGVDSVTNPSAFTLGRDRETDQAFRTRLKSYVRSLARCTVEALEFAAVGLKSGTAEVVFAHVFEDLVNRGDVTLYIDDGAGTAETTASATGENVTLGLAGPPADTAVGGEEFLRLDNWPVRETSPITISSSTRGTLTPGVDYALNPANGRLKFLTPLSAAEIISANYTYFTGLISEVQRVVDGDPNDRLNYPGFRAAGALVRVLSPGVVSQNVAATLTILEGFDQTTVRANVESAISSYINNLGISGDVVRAELIERIMATNGVYNVNLTQPTADQVILDDEIPRIDSSGITIS